LVPPSVKYFPQALQEECQSPVGLTRPGAPRRKRWGRCGAAAAGLSFAGAGRGGVPRDLGVGGGALAVRLWWSRGDKVVSRERAFIPGEKLEPSQTSSGLKRILDPIFPLRVRPRWVSVNPPKKCSDVWVPSSSLLPIPTFGHPMEWPF